MVDVLVAFWLLFCGFLAVVYGLWVMVNGLWSMVNGFGLMGCGLLVIINKP